MNINEMVYFFHNFFKDSCSNKIPFKVGLSPSKKIALFASLKALWKWRGMLFISS